MTQEIVNANVQKTLNVMFLENGASPVNVNADRLILVPKNKQVNIVMQQTMFVNVLHPSNLVLEKQQGNIAMLQTMFANALQLWPPVLEDNIATLLLIMEEVFANAHQTLNVMSVRFASMVNVNADRPIHVLES